MAIISDQAIPVDNVSRFYANDQDIRVAMLRLDQIDPVISGNKWFKLKHNLEAAVSKGYRQILTFGGAYSNHMVAAAAAAQRAGLSSIGIIRGFHGQQQLSTTLKSCMAYGMALHFVSRETYALKNDPDYLQQLSTTFAHTYIIPEGGDNEAGRKGAGEIVTWIPGDCTHICVPVGTGTTFTGIRKALNVQVAMTGFTVMKGGQYLAADMAQHIPAAQNVNWRLEDRFHFGGFAKTTGELLYFIRDFYTDTHIPLDIVYTGKMMFGVRQMISEGYFPEKATLLCLHTGGLQGNPAGLFDV